MRREAGGNAGRERPGAGAGRGAAGGRRKGEKHEATLRMHGLGTQGGPGGQPARYVPRAGGAGLLAAHAVACEGPPPQKAPGAREAAAQGHFGRGKAADPGLPPDTRFAGGVRAGAGPGVSGVCLREGRRGAARGLTGAACLSTGHKPETVREGAARRRGAERVRGPAGHGQVKKSPGGRGAGRVPPGTQQGRGTQDVSPGFFVSCGPEWPRRCRPRPRPWPGHSGRR